MSATQEAEEPFEATFVSAERIADHIEGRERINEIDLAYLKDAMERQRQASQLVEFVQAHLVARYGLNEGDEIKDGMIIRASKGVTDGA